MSWIERDDLVRLIAHAIADPRLSGPVNATAPIPVRNRDFTRVLGRSLRRPTFMRLPAGPLRLLGGALARELLLGGQRVMPDKALASGFVFRNPRLADALHHLLNASPVRPAAVRYASGTSIPLGG
jgi:NAD dependent epimerase/dehydratase family enzyme